VLGDSDLVHIKGSDDPVPVRRLLAVEAHQYRRRSESQLVGREWELNTLTGILGEAISGAGCVVNIVGPPGIGKSRLVRETSAIASARNVPVFTTYGESHTSDIPFNVVARLIRATSGLEGLDRETARARLRAQTPHVDSDDVRILEDLLGFRDPADALPAIAPARSTVLTYQRRASPTDLRCVIGTRTGSTRPVIADKRSWRSSQTSLMLSHTAPSAKAHCSRAGYTTVRCVLTNGRSPPVY
jgi:adenylate cyclase